MCIFNQYMMSSLAGIPAYLVVPSNKLQVPGFML